MAKFTVIDFIDVGTGGEHGATTWKVYKDKEKTVLLDKSEFDRLAEFCGPELSKVERPEDANFYLLLGKLMYVSRQMRDAPSTSKTLMGKHIKDILKLSTNFMDSRGQNIITELVDAQ